MGVDSKKVFGACKHKVWMSTNLEWAFIRGICVYTISTEILCSGLYYII